MRLFYWITFFVFTNISSQNIETNLIESLSKESDSTLIPEINPRIGDSIKIIFKSMKFIVSSEALLKELQILGGVINSTNTLPILDNFLFHLNGNQLLLSASDLETTMSCKLDVESEDSGIIALPARLLLDTLKTFPEQPLTFVKTEKNTLEISANNGKYAVAYLDGEDFPRAVQVKDPIQTKINGKVMATAINATLFASGNDDLRPVMSGVFFQFTTTELTFVATDAHKLVKYTRKDLEAESNAEFIMPKKPLQLLKSILQGIDNDLMIEYNETNAEFKFGNVCLTCRLVEGKYPNYEAVIPKENPNVMQIGRADFLNSVRRVSIFSNKTTHQVRLKIYLSSQYQSTFFQLEVLYLKSLN